MHWAHTCHARNENTWERSCMASGVTPSTHPTRSKLVSPDKRPSAPTPLLLSLQQASVRSSSCLNLHRTGYVTNKISCCSSSCKSLRHNNINTHSRYISKPVQELHNQACCKRPSHRQSTHLDRCTIPASVMRSQKVRSRHCSLERPATAATPSSLISRHTATFNLVR